MLAAGPALVALVALMVLVALVLRAPPPAPPPALVAPPLLAALDSVALTGLAESVVSAAEAVLSLEAFVAASLLYNIRLRMLG
mmetsp:Transcript_94790/g.245348  ORF Transcript_94790/g.245348 Transcript_94790/m.245348 type:complete len:83 (+) Transcript_94790:1455-1703(+)